MASLQGAIHGGTRKNSGRKKIYVSKKEYQKAWGSAHKRIYLTLNIFETWKEAKRMVGYEHSTDSQFVAHLLFLEFRRR